MRVFVTGIAGFAGPAVAAALLEAGHVVHGLVRGAGPWPRLAGLPLAPGALHRGDLAEGRFPDLVRELAPDAVVHLAASLLRSRRRARPRGRLPHEPGRHARGPRGGPRPR